MFSFYFAINFKDGSVIKEIHFARDSIFTSAWVEIVFKHFNQKFGPVYSIELS